MVASACWAVQRTARRAGTGWLQQNLSLLLISQAKPDSAVEAAQVLLVPMALSCLLRFGP